MIESIEWLRMLILDHRSFEYIIIFLGTILGGKLALFTLGFLIGQSVLSTLPVIILGFLGVLVSNTFWFFLAKTKMINRIVASRYTNATTSIITQALVKLSRNKYFLALAMIEFSIGTPIILTTYVSKTDISFKKFIFYQSIVISISLLIIIPLGFASGIGFTYLIPLFSNLYTTIGFVLFLILAIVVIQTWMKNKFTQNLDMEKDENMV